MLNTKLVILCVFLVIISGLLAWTVYQLIHGAWMHLFGKRYFLRKTAKETGRSRKDVLKSFTKFLNEVSETCGKLGYAVEFSMHGPRARMHSQDFSTTGRKMICFGPVWIYLTETASRLSKLAFLQSVGHEIGHRFDLPKGKGFWLRPAAERRLYNWYTEVRNDFFGVEFAVEHGDNASRKTVLNAVSKKADRYIRDRKKKECITHPSWEFRLELLKTHEHFDEEVARKVVAAAGCDENSEWAKAMLRSAKA